MYLPKWFANNYVWATSLNDIQSTKAGYLTLNIGVYRHNRGHKHPVITQSRAQLTLPISFNDHYFEISFQYILKVKCGLNLPKSYFNELNFYVFLPPACKTQVFDI